MFAIGVAEMSQLLKTLTNPAAKTNSLPRRICDCSKLTNTPFLGHLKLSSGPSRNLYLLAQTCIHTCNTKLRIKIILKILFAMHLCFCFTIIYCIAIAGLNPIQ